MQTRFDSTKTWITGCGEIIAIKDMETRHILNTVKMLIQRPTTVQNMLVIDIERADYGRPVWCPEPCDSKAASLRNATSLTADELVLWVKKTPLFNAFVCELEARGVNTENTIDMYESVEPYR